MNSMTNPAAAPPHTVPAPSTAAVCGRLLKSHAPAAPAAIMPAGNNKVFTDFSPV
jgi:hypothetical protein